MRPTALVLSVTLVFGLACTGGGQDTAKPLAPATVAAPPPAAEAPPDEEATAAAAGTDVAAAGAQCCAGPADCDGCPPTYSESDGQCESGAAADAKHCEPVCCGFYDEPGAAVPSEFTATLRGNCIGAPPYADAKVLGNGACSQDLVDSVKGKATSSSARPAAGERGGAMTGSGRTGGRTRTAPATGGSRVNRGEAPQKEETTKPSTPRGGSLPNR